MIGTAEIELSFMCHGILLWYAKPKTYFMMTFAFLKRESCFNLWYGSKYFVYSAIMASDGDLLSHTAMVYTGGKFYIYYNPNT